MLNKEEIEKKECVEMLENIDISTIEMAENIDLFTYSYAVKIVLQYIEQLEKENKTLKDDIELIYKVQIENRNKIIDKYEAKGQKLIEKLEEKITLVEEILHKSDKEMSISKIIALEAEIMDLKEILSILKGEN